jgi:hypothetical protein
MELLIMLLLSDIGLSLLALIAIGCIVERKWQKS